MAVSDTEDFLHGVPFIGGFFGSQEGEAKSNMLHQLALAYQAQRPLMEQSQVNGLNQTLQAYAPANEMLGKMYGPSAMQDLEAFGESPLAPGSLDPGVGGIHSLQQEINNKRVIQPANPTMTPEEIAAAKVTPGWRRQ
jgi:hypothetical protein